MAISTTYYIDTTIFSTATAAWTEPTLTTKAPDGYYSFGGDYREQVSGLLGTTIPCLTCLDCVPEDQTIGTQIWSKCNLNVTTYRDGTPIPQVTNPGAWAALTTGAWCYYNNTTANGTTYGKLYNWYAVAGIHDNNPATPNKILAPIGYHIPTDAEWTTLTDYLDAQIPTGNVGGKMKEAGLCHWDSPNTGATNSSGFTALAGGYRNNDGTFLDIGSNGVWWSSSENGSASAWARYLNYNYGTAFRNTSYKTYGFSVRLIEDNLT